MKKYFLGISVICFLVIFALYITQPLSEENNPNQLSTRSQTVSQENGIGDLTSLRLTDNSNSDKIGASLSRAAEARKLLNLYKSKHLNSGLEGRNLLDTVYALGLERNSENVELIRTLLASNITTHEKLALTRLLASLYTANNLTGLNSEILSDLRGLSHSSNEELARMSVLAYSRLGYFQDSEEMLAYATQRGYIDTKEYLGELAHLMPVASDDIQINLLKKIKEGGNSYPVEILAYMIQDKEALKKFSSKALRDINSLFSSNEPEFPNLNDYYSMTDGVRYAMWLNSTAIITSATQNISYSDYVFGQLMQQNIDPRKIMAFLTSPEADQFIAQYRQTKAIHEMDQKVSVYAAQNPGNATMREAAFEIGNKIRRHANKP